MNKLVENILISQAVCAPIWDGASCLPPTLAGHTAVLPCMTFYDGVFYSPECKILLEQLSMNPLLPWISWFFSYMCFDLVDLSLTFEGIHQSHWFVLIFIIWSEKPWKKKRKAKVDAVSFGSLTFRAKSLGPVDPPNDIFINYFLFLRQLKQCVPSEWNLEQQDRLLWLHVQVETSLLDGNTLM